MKYFLLTAFCLLTSFAVVGCIECCCEESEETPANTSPREMVAGATPPPCCDPKVRPAPSTDVIAAVADDGRVALAADPAWGTIKGQVIFAGKEIPKSAEKKVDANQGHCLEKGPVPGDNWVIDPNTKAVRYVVVFLKPDAGKTLAIHPTLKEPNPPKVELDQPFCKFDPHVLALREGQTMVVLNPAPVAHNIVVQGFKNDTINKQIPPGQSLDIKLVSEPNAISFTCGAHRWMKGFGWVFDHPYFAVTDAKGNFEIKLAPAGAQNLVVWHEEIGYLPPGKLGRKIEVKGGDAVTDVGKIELKPE